MSLSIRPLTSDDAAPYRDIRLEGLRLHPEAFGAAFEQESREALPFFAERLTSAVVIGGFDDGALLCIAGFMAEAGTKRAHKGHLWGMYARPAGRGTGLARAVVEAVLEHARDQVELVQLSVTRGNEAARHLYEAAGFEAYGIEERALKVGEQYYDAIHMMKRLE